MFIWYVYFIFILSNTSSNVLASPLPTSYTPDGELIACISKEKKIVDKMIRSSSTTNEHDIANSTKETENEIKETIKDFYLRMDFFLVRVI